MRGAKPCVFTRFLSGIFGAATFSKCSVFGRVNYATSEARLRSFGFGVPRIEAEPQDFNTHFVSRAASSVGTPNFNKTHVIYEVWSLATDAGP